MNYIKAILVCGISLGTFGGSAQVLVNDTFDYVDLAALQANWGANSGLSLDSAGGNPTPSGAHDGSAQAHIWVGSSLSVTPTDALPLVLTADLWYSGNNNQRNTVGLRNGASPLFEIGFYNQGGPPAANGLSARVLNFAGNENWFELASYTTLGTGAGTEQWIRVQATFTGTAVDISYDLGADDTIDGNLLSSGIGYANPFVDLRFGGPSALLSANGGFAVDNVRLEVVPEPSTWALGLVGVGLWAWIRRRKA